MKLFGTIVYPKNRYLTLQFPRGGKNVMCEDYFENMVRRLSIPLFPLFFQFFFFVNWFFDCMLTLKFLRCCFASIIWDQEMLVFCCYCSCVLVHQQFKRVVYCGYLFNLQKMVTKRIAILNHSYHFCLGSYILTTQLAKWLHCLCHTHKKWAFFFIASTCLPKRGFDMAALSP